MDGIAAEEWPDAASLTDLATIYDQLRSLDQHDRAAKAHGSSEHDSWALAAQRIDQQREALRSRAMDLSRPKIRSLNVIHLPQELLGSIFGFFQHPAVVNQKIDLDSIGMPFDQDRVRVIQNLRLVCRPFNRIASPLLIPILRVQSDQCSLDRSLAILKNPLLAAGLHGIQFRLHSRFNVMATDKSLYIQHQRSVLSGGRSYTEQLFRMDYQNKARFGRPLPDRVVQEFESSCNRREAFDSACDRYIRDEPIQLNESTISSMQEKEKLVEQYLQTLHTSHENYKTKCRQQYQIMSEKLLTNALAKLVSLPSRPVCLSITQMPDLKYSDQFPDNQAIIPYLESAHTWDQIQNLLMWKPVEDDLILQFRSVWDLPIAIHEAGGILDSFGLEEMAMNDFDKLLCPGPLSPTPRILEQLGAACQGLTNFKLAGPRRADGLRPSHIWMEMASMSDFLGQVLSGRMLEKVTLHGSWTATSLDKTLFSVDWPRLKMLSIEAIYMPQSQLVRLCRGLGPEIEHIALNYVGITEGDWAEVLDSLRVAVRRPGRGSMPEIKLSDLTGGNIDILSQQMLDAADPSMTDTPSPMKMFTKYITDD